MHFYTYVISKLYWYWVNLFEKNKNKKKKKTTTNKQNISTDVRMVFGKSQTKLFKTVLWTFRKICFNETYRSGHIGWVIEQLSA